MEEAIRHVRGSNATDAVLLLAYVTRSMCFRWGSILVFKAFCQQLGPNLCVLCISSWFNCFYGEPLLAPHTSGPRDVPRCGALSLLQKDAALQGGDPAETAAWLNVKLRVLVTGDWW